MPLYESEFVKTIVEQVDLRREEKGIIGSCREMDNLRRRRFFSSFDTITIILKELS